MRYSNDEIKDGFVWEGFDYALQVWVRKGVVEPCGHPDWMRAEGKTCCHAYQLAGKLIAEIKGAERRELDST